MTGTEVSRSDSVPTREAVERVLESLRAVICRCRPPSRRRRSRANGYAMARRAEPVALQPVPVRLMTTDLLEFTGASARVALSCSAGFYVRSFAHAIGEQVGTGACLEALRRTRSGPFDLSNAVTLDDLQRDPAMRPAVRSRWIACCWTCPVHG